MKKFFFISCFIMLISQTAFAKTMLPTNESFYRENADMKTTAQKELKKTNILPEQEKVTIPSKGLTNYQYDENKYHYYKIKNYIQNNLDYAQSGRLKY